MNDDNKLILSRIVMVMGTKCSLRCKDCNNLMPLFSPQSCLSANEIIQPLDNLLTKAEVLLTCELIGGEPFLQDSLEECLKYVISHDKIMNIEITTNGTIVPKNENIINLLRNEKVIVRISDYGELVDKNKIVSFLNTNNIRYEILKGTRTWVSPGGTEKRNRTINELTSQWIKCAAGYNCKTIYKGKLFSCARAASLFELNFMKEHEYIDLNSDFDIECIKKFFTQNYSIACDYCNISSREAKRVKAACQL